MVGDRKDPRLGGDHCQKRLRNTVPVDTMIVSGVILYGIAMTNAERVCQKFSLRVDGGVMHLSVGQAENSSSKPHPQMHSMGCASNTAIEFTTQHHTHTYNQYCQKPQTTEQTSMKDILSHQQIF